MQIRKIYLAVFFATTYQYAGVVNSSSDWQGSYAADGKCFCTTAINPALASRVVPTPIGGQTVSQICSLLGDGPGLSQTDGIYNYPVFKDPQCGHGPFASRLERRDVDCVGTMDGTYNTCLSAGPEWALSEVYSESLVLAAANPTSEIKSATTDDKGSHTTLQTLESSTQGTFDALPSFTGKVVTIDGNRYLQARDGMPAQGGERGSRIILDGKVYLKEDENLVLSDLYQSIEKPQLAAAESVEVSDAKKAVDTTSRKADALNSDEQLLGGTTEQLARGRKEREAAVRAKQEKDKSVQEARVAAQRKIAGRKLAELKDLAAQERVEKEQAIQKRLAVQKQLAQRERLAEQQRLAERDRLARQKQLEQQAAIAERQRLAQQERLAEKQRLEQQKQLAEQKANSRAADKSAASAASQQVKTTPERRADSGVSASVLSALRLPAHTRASSQNFAYVEAMPVSYDVGGNGMALEGSIQSNGRFQIVGKLGIADSYQEAMIGGGYYLTPAVANRMTFVMLAGVEFGTFELRDEERAPDLTVTSTDNGLYLGAMSRIVLNKRFELRGGVSYSSFFEGDATVFGGGYFHLTPRLDVMSQFEIGDNDTLGIGIRYYY